MTDFAIKHDDHLLLDQPLLRLPYELLRNNFRAAHLITEREQHHLKSTLRDAANASLLSRSAPADTLRSLDAALTRLRAARDRLSRLADEEAGLHRRIGRRTAHLAELYDMAGVDDGRYGAWSRRRLDRLLVDYLLRAGYYDTARELAREREIEDLVDIDTFVLMGRIKDALLKGSAQEALGWVEKNRRGLKKMGPKPVPKSNFEFFLRLQQFIELVRAQTPAKLLEAVIYAKKHLLPAKETHALDVQQACGLLAYPPPPSGFDPSSRLYHELYSPQRWQMLADVFTQAHNSLLTLPPVPLLHVALSSGLSALKTPACHSPASHAGAASSSGASGAPGAPGTSGAAIRLTSSEPMCPICSAELNELARNVPYAHHTQSQLETDQLLLPNRRAYGFQRLKEHAKKTGLPPTHVKDPRTGEVYSLREVRKVFVT